MSVSFPRCSSERAKAVVFSFLPILTWLPSYPVKKYLLSDVISGLSTGVVQLPQGQYLSACSPKLVVWSGLRVDECGAPAATLQGLFWASRGFCFYIPCGFDTDAITWLLEVFLVESVFPLLHRSCLRSTGCCASSLWSVLLVLPRSALHLFWHVQTCIYG